MPTMQNGPAANRVEPRQSKDNLTRFNVLSGDAPKWIQDVVQNVVFTRAKLLNALLDKRRDLDAECGYPGNETGVDLDFGLYLRMYERNAIANRVVDCFPKEMFQVRPEVYEKRDPKTLTPFEQSWRDIGKYLNASQPSYYTQQQHNSGIWPYLEKADRLSGIGRYGALLYGIDDGKPLSQPVTPAKGASRKLLFLRAFHEGHAQITKVETNPRSPRYGMPNEYRLTLGDPALDQVVSGGVTQVEVHWTRVQHVCEDEVYHAPRQEPVVNNIYDLRKLYGGSAEMYWKGAFFGLSVESPPELGGDVDIDLGTTRDEIEQYMNGLQRFLILTGMNAKSLAPQVVDPSNHIERQLEAICVQLDIPKRKFMGSERGELSSEQDEADWNDKVRKRWANYGLPKLVVPFIDRCIWLGVLPPPQDGYYVDVPDISSQSNSQKADIAVKRSQSLSTYVTSGAHAVMTPVDFFVHVWGMAEDEAIEVERNAMERNEDLDIDPNLDPRTPSDDDPNESSTNPGGA